MYTHSPLKHQSFAFSGSSDESGLGCRNRFVLKCVYDIKPKRDATIPIKDIVVNGIEKMMDVTTIANKRRRLLIAAC